jgi:phosphatidylserine decarboxylase
MGLAARTGLSRWVMRTFVRVYGLNLSEAQGSLADHPNLESLFTRRLIAGARPIDEGADLLVSPVDGAVAAVGCTQDGSITLPGGKALRVHDLLSGAPGEHDVAVLYLSPKDYHRVHVPREGQAVRLVYLPGTLWPVFPAAVRSVEGLFARNERLVVHMRTTAGPLATVLVGAFGVGRISTPLADLLTNTGCPASDRTLDPPVAMERGADLGTFHLGSTVVLVAPKGTWAFTIAAGDRVVMGRAIARLRETADVH